MVYTWHLVNTKTLHTGKLGNAAIATAVAWARHLDPVSYKGLIKCQQKKEEKIVCFSCNDDPLVCMFLFSLLSTRLATTCPRPRWCVNSTASWCLPWVTSLYWVPSSCESATGTTPSVWRNTSLEVWLAYRNISSFCLWAFSVGSASVAVEVKELAEESFFVCG